MSLAPHQSWRGRGSTLGGKSCPGLCCLCPKTPPPTGRSQALWGPESRPRTSLGQEPGLRPGTDSPQPRAVCCGPRSHPLGQSVGFSQLSCFPVRPRVCQGTTSPRAVPAQEFVHVAALASAGDPTPVPRTHCTWLLSPKWPRHAHSAHGHS